MNSRHLLPLLALSLALGSLLPARTQAAAQASTEFSIPQRNRASPLHATLVWENSGLHAIEIRENAGGPVTQRIKVGESETVACDLDQANLPPNWIGTLDYNKDGFEDIYVQTAQGSDPPYAVLLYDAKNKQFVASKPLAEVRGLDIIRRGSPSSVTTGARKLEHSFGVVTKAPNEPPKLVIIGPPLARGVSFQVVSHEDQRVIDAEVVSARQAAADEVMAEGASVYTIEFITSYSERISDEEPFLGIAVVGASDGVTTSGGKASAQLPNAPAGKRLYFRACTSGEGMHLTVWSGKLLVGKRVWHAYHYLGYDVEPNCKPKDYEE